MPDWGPAAEPRARRARHELGGAGNEVNLDGRMRGAGGPLAPDRSEVARVDTNRASVMSQDGQSRGSSTRRSTPPARAPRSPAGRGPHRAAAEPRPLRRAGGAQPGGGGGGPGRVAPA